MRIWMIILIKFDLYYFQKMSLALLRKELETASQDLSTSKGEKTKKKNVGHLILGTERHGMKKKLQKLKAKKTETARFAFKFAAETSDVKVDRTKECLKKLAKLDKIGNKVSASKIIEDNAKRKRQIKPEAFKKRKDEEHKSLFLTDEEVAAIEKEFFLHSKSSKKSKTEDWRD